MKNSPILLLASFLALSILVVGIVNNATANGDKVYGGDDNGNGTEAYVADFTASSISGTIQFTNESTGNITSWKWDFGDGDTSTEQNPSHIYDDSKTKSYTVSLEVTGPDGSDTKTKSDFVIVVNPSDPDIIMN